MAKKRRPETPAAVVENPWPLRAQAFVEKHSFALFLALVTIASVRIALTYTVFNHTVDEPAHIACGMEWLNRGTYGYEAQHPPLARIMTAVFPRLDGAHSWNRPLMYNEGAAILYTDDKYDRTLALARLGILPFFWLASAVVYLWTRRWFGPLAAFFAALAFTFLPSALAHGGLATTDMALTATFGAAFFAMLVWIEKPTWPRVALFGAAIGISILSKFSVLVFFPASAAVAAVCYVLFERPSAARVFAELKARIPQLALALLVACLIIWAGYRFSFDKVNDPPMFGGNEGSRAAVFRRHPRSAGHNRLGNPGYLLGEYKETGWWYYYPVVLSVKTPIAMLALLGVGLAVGWKRRRESPAYWIPAAFALGILLVGAFSRINIGVRHVLPVYLAFSVLAGVGAEWLWRTRRVWVLAVLVLWMMATSALAHPDYLAYFNAFAGDEPSKVLIDSDLDWGQDMKRLSARLREVGATEVAFDPFIIAHLEAVHGFPPIKPLDPRYPLPGWNAVSLTMLKLDRLGLKGHPELQPWPERTTPTERVGKSVWLYYVPPRR